MRAILRFTLVSAIAASSVMLIAPAASALPVDCQFQKAKKLVTITIDNDETGRVWIERLEGTNRIGTRIDGDAWRGCDQARTTDTNKVKVVGSTLSDQVGISLEFGAFAPGASSEREGASEIEFVLDLKEGTDEVYLQGGSGSDRLGFPKPGQASLNGDGDADVTMSGVDRWNMFGGAGNDELDGRGAPRLVAYGDGGADRVVGGAGRDYLVGDYCCGGPGEGADVLIGNAGDDNMYGTGKGDVLNGGLGDDYLNGAEGNDAHIGGAGNDNMYVSSGSDGADVFKAGSGNDYVGYWDRTTRVKVSLDGKANDGGAGEDDNIYPGVERVYGGDGPDILSGDGNQNYFEGGEGDDVITGFDGVDDLEGGNGDDTIKAGDGDEYLYNDAGLDKLYGGDGDDYVNGGSSNDGRDVFSGGAGYDRMDYGNRTQALTIDVTVDEPGTRDGETGENDTVVNDFERVDGGSAGDVIRGSGRDEYLSGGPGSGADFLYGRAGADTLDGNDGNDFLDGGGDYDELYGDTGDDTVDTQDGGEDEAYCGGSGSDAVFARDDIDYINGCPLTI